MTIFYVNMIRGRKVLPNLQVEWLKLLQFDLCSRKFDYVGNPSQMRQGPLSVASPTPGPSQRYSYLKNKKKDKFFDVFL